MRLSTAFWYSESPAMRALRGAVAPVEAFWRAGVGLRNSLYDRGLFESFEPAVPAVSVGNLSVGGTGKTPISAFIAARLAHRQARPALVLRGYGGDEPAVHARLNPGIPVIVTPDRLAGASMAAAQGCDVVVLDDAFQHRRVRRVVDLVLVASEQWGSVARTLPAGPYREPPQSLARADVVFITRKSDSVERAARVVREVATYTSAPVGIVALRLGDLCDATGGLQTLPLDHLAGARVLAVAGIGAPHAFATQLARLGAEVELAAYRDHHAFTASDVGALTRRGARVDLVVCTLKDAVKLAEHWPRADLPLWYVSQRIDLEEGAAALDAELQRLVGARIAAHTPTAG